MRTLVVAFVICLVVGSCQDSGTVQEGKLIGTTNKSVYARNESISVVISNKGPEGAYLSSCCHGLAFYVDRFENDSWHQFEGHGIPCLAMCPVGAVFLETEHQYVEGLTLQGRGTYRLRIPFGTSHGDGMSKELTTTTFTVQ